MTATVPESRTARCAKRLSYAPGAPDDVCGEKPAGFALTLTARVVETLLDGRELTDLQAGMAFLPIAYCATHLRDLEDAFRSIRERGGSASAGEAAAGVLWLEESSR